MRPFTPIQKSRLVLGMSQGDSILVQLGDTEVEITLNHDNPSTKARLVFHAPRSVEIMRIPNGENGD